MDRGIIRIDKFPSQPAVDGVKGDQIRTTVKLGRSSVSTIEIVEGLQPGDQVILSDMSTYDEYQRVRLSS